MTSLRTSCLVAVLGLTTACAGLEPQPVRLDARLASLNIGNMGVRNGYELRNASAIAGRADVTVPVDDTRPRERRPITPVLFWLGIGLTAVGGVSTIGTAAGGYATQRQISSDYRGSATADEIHTLERRGETLNKATIASVVVTVVGAVLALTSYGVDYTRCGPLAPKRRRQTAPQGRCAAEDSK
jgi:hypothetical protein